MKKIISCPDCQSTAIIKNGSNANGKKKNKCKNCKRQFVLNPQKQAISEEKKALIARLLLERISLAGIARATMVSARWLQYHVNEKYQNVARFVSVSKKRKGRLTLEGDELWSYVGKKDNKQWLWLATDRSTREIVGAYIGDRSRQSAQKLWDSFPAVYRQCAVTYTDFWEAYKNVFPSTRHRAVGKETGQTSHIERLNCTFRQRVSRLVRQSLSFSKKLSNHIGAIWYFIHAYNEALLF